MQNAEHNINVYLERFHIRIDFFVLKQWDFCGDNLCVLINEKPQGRRAANK